MALNSWVGRSFSTGCKPAISMQSAEAPITQLARERFTLASKIYQQIVEVIQK